MKNNEYFDREYTYVDPVVRNLIKLEYYNGYNEKEHDMCLPLMQSIQDKVIKETKAKTINNLISRINNQDYCELCIHWNKEKEDCDYDNHIHCDTDAMERAIVRMLEDNK